MKALFAFVLGVVATAVVLTQTRKPKLSTEGELGKLRGIIDDLSRDVEELERLEQRAATEREETIDPRFFSTRQLAAGKKPSVH